MARSLGLALAALLLVALPAAAGEPIAICYASLRLEIGSAYTIVFLLMILPLLLLIQRLGRWGAVSRR